MKKFFFGILVAFFFVSTPHVVHANWWDDVTGFAESIECIIDLDIDLDFQFGEHKPVFDGPGLKKGARMVRCQLDQNVSKEKDLPTLIIGWIRFFLSLTAVLAVAAFVFAGFTYVTAMGDDSRVETAKNIILYTVLGILLILGAYGIVNTLMKARFGAEESAQHTQTHIVLEYDHHIPQNKHT